MWLLLVAQQQYCECEKFTDLVEVLVFSTVDMRRANASTTLLLPPLTSSFAWVNSYSSGSTPAHANQHTCDTPAYACMQQRSFERTVKDIDANRAEIKKLWCETGNVSANLVWRWPCWRATRPQDRKNRG